VAVGCCERGDEPSGYVEGGEFVGYLSDCQLRRKDCAIWI
jgi:hypothetical protein